MRLSMSANFSKKNLFIKIWSCNLDLQMSDLECWHLALHRIIGLSDYSQERSRVSCPEGVALVPVVYRIKFKLALVMFTIHTHQCPDYLTDSVHPYNNNDPACYRLRLATGANYSVPLTRTKFGDRASSVSRPVMWNSLPAAVRHTDSLHSFKRRLKSHFF